MRYVPTKVLAPILRDLIEQRFGYISDDGLQVLEEKSGVPWDTIWGIINERREGCDFDAADELLCALGQPQLWREEPLEAIYFALDLSWVKCQCPGCNTQFQLGKDTLGREVYRKYCSRQCNQAAFKLRRGRNQHRLPLARRKDVGRPVGVVEKKCRNGHTRTAENTRRKPSGQIECAICARNAARRRYERKKAVAA